MADIPNDQAPLDPDFQPEEVRLIGDVESLRAIGDPTRVRILETMVQRLDPAWSVKELAAAIGVPQTRLYHHVDLLLERDLIRAVERRVVSGIIETRYRVVATSFQLDRRLLEGDPRPAARSSTRRSRRSSTPRATRSSRDRHRHHRHPGDAPEERRVMLSHAASPGSPPTAPPSSAGASGPSRTEFGDDADPTGQPCGFVLALYPMPHPVDDDYTEEPTDG